MAVFNPRPMQAPNLTTNYAAENAAFANLGQSLGNLIPEFRKQQEAEATRALLGEAAKSGDFNKAGLALLGQGKVPEAAALIGLGQKAADRDFDRANIFGGASPSPQASLGNLGQSGGPTGSALPASLSRSESGGNWGAQNNAVGAGGAVGHFGRAQFGQARLQEAAAAGVIPQGTTPQQFMNSPELQRAAENWHFGDIDSKIRANGYDRLVGQTIRGVPITVEGLRAVAHLGGTQGMKRFVETGGGYNPSDRNGTSLMDYFTQHGGRSRVASADMPSSDAALAAFQGGDVAPIPGDDPAQLRADAQRYARSNPEAARQMLARADAAERAGGGGFFIPPGEQAAPAPAPQNPGMTGRTFDAIQSVDAPLRPAFEAEGVSQPWMGTALSPQQASPAVAAGVPRRPVGTAQADIPARGAAQTVANAPQAQPDYTSADNAGSLAFAVQEGERRRGQSPAPSLASFLVQQPSAAAAPVARQPASAPQVAAAASGAQTQPSPDMPAPGAVQAQGYTPQQAQSIASDPEVQKWQQRAATARTEAGQKYAQRGLDIAIKDAEQRIANGKDPETVREFVWAKRNGMTTAKNPAEYAKEKTKTSPEEETEGRKAAAAAAGLRPGDAGYQGFILTGKMPREDAGPLSATDKKAILEADEAVASGESAVRALNEAKGLSKRAMSGPTAGWRAAAGNNLPDWLVPDGIASPEASEATANLENTVTSNALSQMKAIFGGNPTEGERKILLDIQGSINQPDNVRQGIYDRAIRAAEARLAFNRQRATELRGGTYYKPGTGDPGGQTQSGPRANAAQPDVSQAKQASDGKWYVPDPSRPGKYLQVNP